MSNFKRVSVEIDALKDVVIEWQRRLVSIKALGPENGGEGELYKAQYIKKVLGELGFVDLQEINAPDSRVPGGYRPNILAKKYGENRKKTLWILAHMDVVPAGDLSLWQSDPFELKVNGDKLIGRGTEDNHQGLVCALAMVRALQQANVEPKRNIGLAIVADEESGSKFGLDYVLKNSKDFNQDDLIIVPDAGDPEGKTIEISEKSIMWVKFHIKGKQCHASTPQFGHNAHKAAAHLVVELESLHDLYPKQDSMYDTPWSTFEPTKKQANVPNINTIPGEDIFFIDCRILPEYPIQDVEQALEAVCRRVEKEFKVEIEISYPQKEQAAPPTSRQSPVVYALSTAIQAVKKTTPQIIGIGGGTVAAFFRRAGFSAAVWGTIADVCHQPNEYSLISNTLIDAKILAYIALQDD